MRHLFLSLSLFVLLLTSCSASTETPSPQVVIHEVTATAAPQSFRVVAYVTEAIVDAIIPYEKLTHINYAFLLPNKDGTFDHILDEAKLHTIVEHAHQKDVKVLISVGGWGWDKQFETVAADPLLRSVFIHNLKAFVDSFQLDGVDIDWEYPDAGASAQNFLALIRDLRAALPDKEITSAVVAYGENAIGILSESFKYFDFVNVMTYDGQDHGTMEQFKKGLSFWRAQGLLQDKIVMGVPFYGDPDLPYRKIVAADSSAAQLDSFNYYGTLYHYNGIPTVEAKTRLAMQQAGGIMFWTLDDDAQGEYSLVNAIYHTLHS